MLRSIFVAAGLLLAATVTAAADDGAVPTGAVAETQPMAAAPCDGPWLTRAELDSVSQIRREQDFRNLLDCVEAGIATANTLLKHVSDVAGFADRAANDRTALGADNGRLGDEQGALRDAVAKLDDQRKVLTKKLATCQDRLDKANTQITGLVDQVGKLSALNRELEARVAALQSENGELQTQNDLLHGQLDEATAKIKALTDEIHGLGAEIITLQGLVKDGNDEIAALKGQIEELTKSNATLVATNQQLACKIDRLADGRRIFFQNLSAILKSHGDILIIDDRLVVQADILFDVGSAKVSSAGKGVVGQIGEAIVKLEADPALQGLHWLVQINGHTDVQPIIYGSHFRDNWQLSTERALSIVKLLLEDAGRRFRAKAPSFSGARLAAAGFGEFQPIAPELTQAAYARNRRIEFRIVDYDYPRDIVDDCTPQNQSS